MGSTPGPTNPPPHGSGAMSSAPCAASASSKVSRNQTQSTSKVAWEEILRKEPQMDTPIFRESDSVEWDGAELVSVTVSRRLVDAPRDNVMLPD